MPNPDNILAEGGLESYGLNGLTGLDGLFQNGTVPGFGLLAPGGGNPLLSVLLGDLLEGGFRSFTEGDDEDVNMNSTSNDIEKSGFGLSREDIEALLSESGQQVNGIAEDRASADATAGGTRRRLLQKNGFFPAPNPWTADGLPIGQASAAQLRNPPTCSCDEACYGIAHCTSFHRAAHTAVPMLDQDHPKDLFLILFFIFCSI